MLSKLSAALIVEIPYMERVSYMEFGGMGCWGARAMGDAVVGNRTANHPKHPDAPLPAAGTHRKRPAAGCGASVFRGHGCSGPPSLPRPGVVYHDLAWRRLAGAKGERSANLRIGPAAGYSRPRMPIRRSALPKHP